MTVMLIANNCTRESGSFMGDQLCLLKACYLFVQGEPDVDKLIISLSPKNEMHFLWEKFLDDPRGDGSKSVGVEVIWDDWNPGNWAERHSAWDKWRIDRAINGRPFDVFRECYLRIHGAVRQRLLCGGERGLGRRNIYSYWYCGQEHCPDELPQTVDWFDDTLIYHPPHTPERDVYISPHAKTQGNSVFTFQFWSDVVHLLVDAGVTVTVGYNSSFCEDLNSNPFYKKFWGDHHQWMEEVCRHKLVACGNTGTGWLAAACGVPMITMEPPNSQMVDHRYRECGLRNIAELISSPDPEYVASQIIKYVGGSAKSLSMSRVCHTAAPHSINPHTKLMLVAKHLDSVSNLDGDMVDLGAYRGGTSMVMRGVAPDKHLHVVDTWDGNPHDDEMCHHRRGEWVADMSSCQALVGNGDLTHYHKGVFPQSAESLKDRRFCFVYVDMDTRQSTRDAIEFFWPRLVPGGKLLVDDYGWEPCAGVKVAVDEIVSASTDFGDKVMVDPHTCILEKK